MFHIVFRVDNAREGWLGVKCWQTAALLAAVAAGAALGRVAGLPGQPAGTGGMQRASVPRAGAEWAARQPNPPEAELFAAVERYLKAARLPPQDMPQRILAVTETSPGRYRIRMAMVRGEGWFEVWQEHGKWQVRGVQPPGSS